MVFYAATIFWAFFDPKVVGQPASPITLFWSQAVFHNITRTRLYFIIPHKKAVYDVIHEGGTTRGSDSEGVALVYVESSSSYEDEEALRRIVGSSTNGAPTNVTASLS